MTAVNGPTSNTPDPSLNRGEAFKRLPPIDNQNPGKDPFLVHIVDYGTGVEGD